MAIKVKKKGSKSRREKVLARVDLIPGMLSAISKRKSISRKFAERLLGEIGADVDLFANFVDGEGDAFAEEDATKKAEIDATLASLTSIRDGIKAKIDALETDPKGTVITNLVPSSAMEKPEGVLAIMESDAKRRGISQRADLRTGIRKFGTVGESVESKIRNMQPDSFTSDVVSLISSELENEE